MQKNGLKNKHLVNEREATFYLWQHVLLEGKPVFSLFVSGLFLVVISCAVLNLLLSLLFETKFINLGWQYKTAALKNIAPKPNP